MTDETETPVIFRKWKDGAVIALFPAEPGDMNPATCSSYMHVGQHGAADPQLVIQQTKPAAAAEYADLKQELESAGYQLKLYRRLQRSFYALRREGVR
jgi:hypothetical protein